MFGCHSDHVNGLVSPREQLVYVQSCDGTIRARFIFFRLISISVDIVLVFVNKAYIPEQIETSFLFFFKGEKVSCDIFNYPLFK